MIRVRRRATTITKALIGRQPNVGIIFLTFSFLFFRIFVFINSKKKSFFVFSDFSFLAFVCFSFFFFFCFLFSELVLKDLTVVSCTPRV